MSDPGFWSHLWRAVEGPVGTLLLAACLALAATVTALWRRQLRLEGAWERERATLYQRLHATQEGRIEDAKIGLTAFAQTSILLAAIDGRRPPGLEESRVAWSRADAVIAEGDPDAVLDEYRHEAVATHDAVRRVVARVSVPAAGWQ